MVEYVLCRGALHYCLTPFTLCFNDEQDESVEINYSELNNMY